MLCNLKIDVSNKISCARIKKYILKEPVRLWKLLFVPVMFASIVVIAKPPAFWNIIDPPPTPHPKVRPTFSPLKGKFWLLNPVIYLRK